MNLHFTGQNLSVTPALKDFTIDKFKILEKRDHTISRVDVIFHIENLTHVAEATIHVNGADMHAKAKEDDMYKAISVLSHKLLAQIIKHKERVTDHHGAE